MITALLGPTNTGKTHRALERMLEHATGAIGVPLRLLAREVYDKLTMRVGESRVALLTGEEKRIPSPPGGHASYWVCTVEAMPADLEVEFVAIDEIQLAAHDQRGHVFTDRLLHARGTKETWFLGSDTMKPIVEALVPTATIVRLPRLSKLSHVPATSLAAVPPRSAVVAFSADDVFALAERIRARRGGAAVVLGLLSPRARNAQVAMFQAGEVDHIVATDAIGMGLNLDVRHVAFASLRKFDGREARDLEPAEVAQIAGRAGRHTRDGTFGAIAPASIAADVVRAVEAHRFAPVTRIRWRNSDLDFSSVDALVASLRISPKNARLSLDRDAEDLAALVALAHMPGLRERARGEEQLRLLWDVCRIPDYRKLLFESHVALLATLFVRLCEGTLDPYFVEPFVRELDEDGGDIDTLTARLTAIRTWSYIVNQSHWVERARAWQERTRAIEDRVSDALHAKLVARFVERTQKRIIAGRSVTVPRAPKVDASHPFARLASMRAEMVGEYVPAGDDWVETLIDAPHARFCVDARGQIGFGVGGDHRVLATLVRGASLLAPDVRLSNQLELTPGERSRVLRRVVAYARDLVEELVGALRTIELSPAGRGLAYQLEHTLGTVLNDEACAQLDALTAEDRAALTAVGVHLGDRVTYLEAALRRDAVERRALFASLYFDRAPRVPRAGAPSFAAHRADPRACLAIGHPVFAERALRADVVEAFLELPVDAPMERVATLLGCSKRELPTLIDAIVSV